MAKINLSDVQSVILISDMHLGVRNASIEWAENITSYINNFFIPLIREHKKAKPNSIIIIAGDYFDNRQALDINIMTIGMQIMDQLAEELPVYIFTGNHDVYKKNDNFVNSLVLFNRFKNVKVITTNTILKFKHMNFLLYPWTGDIKKDAEYIMNLKDVDYAIMHEDVKGLSYDNGRQIVRGFDSTIFKGKKIYSGHIHKRQESERVTYIGSPYQLRRSDIGNQKGIYILDVDGEDVIEHFYKNEYSPVFLKLKIEDLFDVTLGNLKKILANNYVDIIIKRSDLGNINMPSLTNALNDCTTKKLEIKVDNNVGNILNESVSGIKDLTVEDIVKEKISKLEISEEQKNSILTLNHNYIVAFNESVND